MKRQVIYLFHASHSLAYLSKFIHITLVTLLQTQSHEEKKTRKTTCLPTNRQHLTKFLSFYKILSLSV